MRGHDESLGRSVRDLLHDTRGVVQIEYIIVVGIFALGVAASFVARSDMLVLDYANSRDLLLLGGM